MKLPKLVARIKQINKNPDKLEGNFELTIESWFCKLQVHRVNSVSLRWDENGKKNLSTAQKINTDSGLIANCNSIQKLNRIEKNEQVTSVGK